MQSFIPSLVIIRKNALDYPLGKKLYKLFSEDKHEQKTEVKIAPPRGRLPLDYDLPFRKKFHRAKRILLVGVRTVNNFQTCKPSAHFQLPLVSGCPGHCHYCYLSTNLGKSPYVKTYVNIEEILDRAQEYIDDRKPEETVFEGAATSDPLPIEKYTGSLAQTIKFFADNKSGRFRFVSKFNQVDSLLELKHNNHTEIRFSLNSKEIINRYEPGTPELSERIKAAAKTIRAGYPTGLLIAPLFITENWQQEYNDLLKSIKKHFPEEKIEKLTLEIITHRFTERAREIINKAYPQNKLPMNEENRQFKYGQFGYGKYIYPQEQRDELENFFRQKTKKHLPGAKIKYFI